MGRSPPPSDGTTGPISPPRMRHKKDHHHKKQRAARDSSPPQQQQQHAGKRMRIPWQLPPCVEAAADDAATVMEHDFLVGDVRAVWLRRPTGGKSLVSNSGTPSARLDDTPAGPPTCALVSRAGLAFAMHRARAEEPELAPGVTMARCMQGLVTRDASRAFSVEPGGMRECLVANEFRQREFVPSVALLMVAAGVATQEQKVVLRFRDCVVARADGSLTDVASATVTLRCSLGSLGTVRLQYTNGHDAAPAATRHPFFFESATCAMLLPGEEDDDDDESSCSSHSVYALLDALKVRAAPGAGGLAGDHPGARVSLLAWLQRTFLLHMGADESARRAGPDGEALGCGCAYCARVVHPLVKSVAAAQCKDPTRAPGSGKGSLPGRMRHYSRADVERAGCCDDDGSGDEADASSSKERRRAVAFRQSVRAALDPSPQSAPLRAALELMGCLPREADQPAPPAAARSRKRPRGGSDARRPPSPPPPRAKRQRVPTPPPPAVGYFAPPGADEPVDEPRGGGGGADGQARGAPRRHSLSGSMSSLGDLLKESFGHDVWAAGGDSQAAPAAGAQEEEEGEAACDDDLLFLD